MFQESFSKLYPKIKSFVYFGLFVRDDFNSKTVIGVNCSSGSVVRKDECMRRVKEFIEELNLPVEVKEEFEQTKYFKIVNK